MRLDLRFERPIFLLFLILLPLAFLIFRYSTRRSSSRWKNWLVLCLRLLLLTLTSLTLAQPLVTVPTPGQTVVFVVDRSASISPALQEQASAFITAALQKKPATARSGIISFNTTPQVELTPTAELFFPAFRSEPPGDLTNIEASLELALAHLPTEGGRRIVLISDGEENSGDTERIIPKLRAKNVPVDVFPLYRPATPEALIEQLSLPRRSKSGEPFLLQVVCRSTEQAAGELFLYLNERFITTQPVTLQPGLNLFLFPQTLSQPGVYRYRVELVAEPDTLVANNQAGGLLTVPGQKPLLLVGEATAATHHFVTGLAKQGLAVEEKTLSSFPPSLGALSAYSAVILNNLPWSRLTPHQVELIQTYVHDLGGGLITITGKTSAAENGGQESPLAAMLPVHSRIEQRVLFPTLSLLILIDTSGSMDQVQYEGGFSKLRLAKEATIAALQLLVEEERMGVLAFDSQPRWVVSLQNVEDPERIVRRIAPLQTGSSTNLYAALEEAYRSLIKEETAIRHILLLSDGISDPGDFETLAQAIASSGITISTVGIGKDADRELLANLAAWGRGRTFYTDDFNSIPQIFISETSRVLRGAVEERRFRPQLAPGSSLLAEFNWGEAPELGGFVRTTPRQTAEIFLHAPDRSPVLAGWRYGLGRTVSFLSDLGENWAQNWMEWPAYGDFWRQVVNWVIPTQPYNMIHPQVSADDRHGLIHVDALDLEGNLVNFLQIQASVVDPQGETETFNLVQTGPGEYRASFPLVAAGEYLVAVTGQTNGTPTKDGPVLAGLSVPYSPEYKLSAKGRLLLPKLTAATGGRLLTAPEEVFAGSPGVSTKGLSVGHQLIPWIIFLFLLEMALRFLPKIAPRSFPAAIRLVLTAGARILRVESRKVTLYERRMQTKKKTVEKKHRPIKRTLP